MSRDDYEVMHDYIYNLVESYRKVIAYQSKLVPEDKQAMQDIINSFDSINLNNANSNTCKDYTANCSLLSSIINSVKSIQLSVDTMKHLLEVNLKRSCKTSSSANDESCMDSQPSFTKSSKVQIQNEASKIDGQPVFNEEAYRYQSKIYYESDDGDDMDAQSNASKGNKSNASSEVKMKGQLKKLSYHSECEQSTVKNKEIHTSKRFKSHHYNLDKKSDVEMNTEIVCQEEEDYTMEMADTSHNEFGKEDSDYQSSPDFKPSFVKPINSKSKVDFDKNMLTTPKKDKRISEKYEDKRFLNAPIIKNRVYAEPKFEVNPFGGSRRSRKFNKRDSSSRTKDCFTKKSRSSKIYKDESDNSSDWMQSSSDDEDFESHKSVKPFTDKHKDKNKNSSKHSKKSRHSKVKRRDSFSESSEEDLPKSAHKMQNPSINRRENHPGVKVFPNNGTQFTLGAEGPNAYSNNGAPNPFVSQFNPTNGPYSQYGQFGQPGQFGPPGQYSQPGGGVLPSNFYQQMNGLMGQNSNIPQPGQVAPDNWNQNQGNNYIRKQHAAKRENVDSNINFEPGLLKEISSTYVEEVVKLIKESFYSEITQKLQKDGQSFQEGQSFEFVKKLKNYGKFKFVVEYDQGKLIASDVEEVEVNDTCFLF